MTPEDKQLLFKDICARLPYGIYCQIRYKRKNKVLEECKQLDGTYFNSIECLFRSESGAEYSADYKPYLRPMESMTDEEQRTLDSMCYGVEMVSRLSGLKMFDKAFNWLNENHFDYRGLILMGLAIEAPEGMYKTE